MKDPETIIRRVNDPEEKKACAAIMAASEPWITLHMSMDHLTTTLSDPLNEVYGAYMGKELAGTMIVQTRGAFSGYLKSIAVKPEWRGRKLGEAMMAFLEDMIFASCTNLFLCVSSFNTEAQRFYQRLGYEQAGVLKNYLVEGHDEILMRKTTGPILSEPFSPGMYETKA